ncbi:MAG: type I secretion system permease/ATPase, partial [Rhodospirillales bacterium]
MAQPKKKPGNAAFKALGSVKGLFVFLLVLSGVINILALTGAFYMLQIYDRALVSGSVPTLLAISALAIGLYLFQGVFDILRSQILVRMGARLDRRLAPMAHQLVIDMPRHGYSTSEALERGRDVDTVRGFFGSQGPIALFDLPWMPVFLAFVYFLHPYLGALTIAGAFVLTSLAIAAELRTRSW